MSDNIMLKIFICLVLSATTANLHAQLSNKLITVSEVQRIETALSSDEMQGRKAFTASSEKAAGFISSEFKKIGLSPLKGLTGYLQPFTMVKAKLISASASFDGFAIEPKNIVAFTCLPELTITEESGFKKVNLPANANFMQEVSKYSQLKENTIVFVDKDFSKYFSYLPKIKEHLFTSGKSVVFILGSYTADNYEITAKHEIIEEQSANIVGVLPGKSKREQLVVFSGHYDHLGIEKPENGDSIFNGANDDASGVTAVIAMAKYYKALNTNERTLLFVAFTAEEAGGFGSQYFSRQLDPDKVAAMFNIEMIGTESKWGKNSAYITGFEKSDLGKILQSNLKGSRFSFHPDPYTAENLFYRSDNATLARLGVPAHTISTSKMDNEPNYHKVSDEVKTLDMNNMTAVIRAIVISAKSIVGGKDTPTRVDVNELNK